MALLFMDGFDAGDVTNKWDLLVGSTSSTTTRFNAGRSLALNTGGLNSVTKYFSASAEIYTGFAARTVYIAADNIPFCNFMTDNGTTTQLNIVSNANASLAIRRGATVLASTVGGIVATGWHSIEIRAKIDPTAGFAQILVDGSVAASFTGNTKNGGTSNNIDSMQLTNSGSNSNVLFDDVYICNSTGPAPYNTYLGDVRISTITPDGAGSSTGFTASSGANYTTVDELPASATDYVSASASGTRDTYSMSNISGSYSVLAVQHNVVAKKVDAGGAAIRPAIVSGGTVYYGPNKTLTATDTTASDIRTVDPATSAAWTVAGVNALEAGMEIA